MTIRIRRSLRASLLAVSCALIATGAQAHRPLHPGGHYGPVLVPFTAAPRASGTWTPLNSAFPGGPDTALLMTDGTVMMHSSCTGNWYRLTPDLTGNYIAGSWHPAKAMPSGYTPLYFASEVLPDGRMIMNGGEYNGSTCAEAWTKLGALYDPVKNAWTRVAPPTGWGAVGDAASAILPDGSYMLQQSVQKVKGKFYNSTAQAIATISPLPGTTVTWTATGSGKADPNDEEGWTVLSNGDVLAVDTNTALGADTPAELYSPASGMWTVTGTAPNILVDPTQDEIGPAVLLPNGKVFQTGASPCAAIGCPGHTALFSAGSWTAGPDFPMVLRKAYDVTDGPASILPDGNVLVQTSPAYACKDSSGNPSPYCSPSHFFEFNGKSLVRVNEPADAPHIAAYEGRMLALPTGQILWSSDQGDVEVYTPQGSPNAAWLPAVQDVATTLMRGTANYTATGKKFKGVSNGAAYGDDAQMNTNYPLVRIANNATGHVCYARTHDFTATQTMFDMPAATPPVWEHPCQTGASTLQVVVNGLASASVAVTVE